MSTNPGVGDPAPDVKLIDQDGRTVRLSELRGRTLVLFFYPKDFSPGCSSEACAFRDAHEEFGQAGATVFGISSDPTERHAEFRARRRLPFDLLSDPDGEARIAFGAVDLMGFMPGRVTFVIDADGVIRDRYSSQVRFAAHARRALEAVRRLGNSPAPSPAAPTK